MSQLITLQLTSPETVFDSPTRSENLEDSPQVSVITQVETPRSATPEDSKLVESTEKTSSVGKYLAYGALALGTAAVVGGLCYYAFSSTPETQEPTAAPPYFDATCISPGHLETLGKQVTDLCSSLSPFRALCEGNLGIPRSMMPQVNSSVLQHDLAEKTAQGLECIERIIDPTELTPVQSELFVPAISGMIGSWMRNTWDPCKERIISAAGYVIDGHHRWAACTLLQRPMTILDIQDTAQNVLAELNHLQGVFHLTMGQRIF